MNDEERRKIWWSEDGSLCLLCGGTGSANVFIDGEPTQMDGPCPNCENNDLRSENYNLQAKLREHPHLFMKGMFADQGWLHSSKCWCHLGEQEFLNGEFSWRRGTENIPTDEKCAECGGAIQMNTLAGFRTKDNRRVHNECPTGKDHDKPQGDT